MKEERLKILEMVESGIITAKEASKLMDAVEEPNKESKAEKADWIRIEVYDKNRSNREVNIKLPMSIVRAALKIGSKFADKIQTNLSENDLAQIVDAVNNAKIGEVVTIETDDNQIVDITLE